MKFVKATTLYNDGKVLKDIYIGFDKTITSIGTEKPQGEIVAEGYVTPAFIDAHSHIGMVRAGEPSGEDESNEHMDSIYPLSNALHSVYMDDAAFRDSVENNVLYSVVLPGSGNPIGGKAVLLRNFGTNIKDAYVQDIGIKAALGYNPRSVKDWNGKRPSTRMGAIALLRERFIKARKLISQLENDKKTEDEIEPLDEVFMKILKGEDKLMVHLHREDDAYVLMSMIDEFGFKAIVNHGMDFYRPEVLHDMKKRGISLIYGPLDSHPYKVELKHESWRNCKLIMDSGVRFCMMSDHPVILQRNLFLTMRHFMKFGMSREEAVSKLTVEPAEILGIKQLGRIEKGFLASFTVWDKDPFEIDAQPRAVIAEGESVLES